MTYTGEKTSVTYNNDFMSCFTKLKEHTLLDKKFKSFLLLPILRYRSITNWRYIKENSWEKINNKLSQNIKCSNGNRKNEMSIVQEDNLSSSLSNE